MTAKRDGQIALGAAGVLLLVWAAAGSATTGVPPLAFGASIPVSYPSSGDQDNDAESITIGKLNGDTRPDLAIISDIDSTVSVVLNRGAGRFKAVAEYDTAPEPGDTAIADVNGDAKPDLLVTNGQTVSVLLNRGDGTFLPRVNYPAERVGGDTNVISMGDLNGDARPDIVAGDNAVKGIAVLMNNGDGTFAPPVTYPTPTGPVDVKLGDLNGDGRLDVATAGRSHAVSLFTGNGDGTLQARKDYAAGGAAVSVALADFNGDGKLDLASGNCCSVSHGISLFLNSGDGNFAPARDYSAGERSEAGVSLDAVDMNRDGRPDFAYSTPPFANQVRLNRGEGRFEPQLTAPTTGRAPGLERGRAAIGDLNGDGRPDEAYSTLNDRNGDWNTWVRLQNRNDCDVQPERGKTLALARRTLALANCRVGRITYAHTTKVKRGGVLSQKPAGGVWRKGKTVALVISRGR